MGLLGFTLPFPTTISFPGFDGKINAVRSPCQISFPGFDGKISAVRSPQLVAGLPKKPKPSPKPIREKWTLKIPKHPVTVTPPSIPERRFIAYCKGFLPFIKWSNSRLEEFESIVDKELFWIRELIYAKKEEAACIVKAAALKFKDAEVGLEACEVQDAAEEVVKAAALKVIDAEVGLEAREVQDAAEEIASALAVCTVLPKGYSVPKIPDFGPNDIFSLELVTNVLVPKRIENRVMDSNFLNAYYPALVNAKIICKSLKGLKYHERTSVFLILEAIDSEILIAKKKLFSGKYGHFLGFGLDLDFNIYPDELLPLYTFVIECLTGISWCNDNDDPPSDRELIRYIRALLVARDVVCKEGM